MATAKHDFTPSTRKRVYDTLAILTGIIIPVAAVWGIKIDEQVLAAGIAVAGAVAGAVGNYLARRNVESDYVGQHRAGE